MNAMAQGYGAFAAEMLRVGDVLHAVDGKSVLTEPIKSIHGYTIGAEGSLCTLRVSRGSEAPFDVKVTRLALRDHGRQRDFMFAGPQYGCHYTETRALIAPTPRDEESELGAELQERMRSQDAQIKQLTRKLEDSRNESAETIAALRQKLHETQEDAYRASAELVSATAPLSAKDKEIEQLNAKLADLKQAHDGCESTVSELERKLSDAQVDQAEMWRMRSIIESYEEELGQSRITLHELKSEQNQQKTSSAQRDREIERLKRELSISLDCHSTEVKVLKEAGEESNTRIAVLEVQNADKDDVIAGHEKTIAGCAGEVRLLQEGKVQLAAELRNLRSRLEQAATETQVLQQGHEQVVKAKEAALADRDRQIQELNEAAEQWRTSATDKSKALVALEAKCKELETDVAAATARIAEMELAHKETTASHTASVARLEDANREVARTLEHALERANAHVAARDRELAELTAAHDRQAATDAAVIRALEKTVEEVRGEHAPCCAAMASREAEIKVLRKELGALRAVSIPIREARNALHQDVAKLQRTIESLESASVGLQEQEPPPPPQAQEQQERQKQQGQEEEREEGEDERVAGRPPPGEESWEWRGEEGRGEWLGLLRDIVQVQSRVREAAEARAAREQLCVSICEQTIAQKEAELGECRELLLELRAKVTLPRCEGPWK